jgi:hypothetical protein
VTSHASCPNGVLILHYFHKVLKELGDFKILMAAGYKVLNPIHMTAVVL